jgi:hypothetical protein
MDELKAIREGMAGLPTRQEFGVLQRDMTEVKADMKVVKAAVTDLSRQVNNHEGRITGAGERRLEALRAVRSPVGVPQGDPGAYQDPSDGRGVDVELLSHLGEG